ncbi:hypothetical protein ACV7JQ_01505 [Globicatella sulfidifaciens]
MMLRDFIKENEWKKDHGMAKQQMKIKEFIILLHYMKGSNNFERVMAAVEELNGIRWGYVSTERILFLCEQSEPTEVTLARDETTNQSESNLKAYASLFHQADKEVIHYG